MMLKLQFLPVLFVALSASAAGGQIRDCDKLSPAPGEPPGYGRLVCQAQNAMDTGKFSDAATLFEQALQVEWFEVPNYDLYPQLALAKCKLGEREPGRRIVTDFECMLRVDSGELPCYSGEVPDKDLGYRLVRHDGLTDRCFAVMCGEIYLAYYVDPSKEMLDALAKRKKALAPVKAACADTK